MMKINRNAPRRRFGCHLSVVALDFCEVRISQRQTFENVFLIYKIARLAHEWANKRRCKDMNKSRNDHTFRDLFAEYQSSYKYQMSLSTHCFSMLQSLNLFYCQACHLGDDGTIYA